MATVLLADDERLFKAVEGSLLRRDACRLLKAAPDDFLARAQVLKPDLLVLSISDEDSRRLLSRICDDPALSGIPVIAVELKGGRFLQPPAPQRTPVRGTRGKRPRAPVDVIPVQAGGAKAEGEEGQEERLDRAIRRHLSITIRATDRVTADVMVRCTASGGSFRARTKDLSPSGLFLRTDRPLGVGESVRVSFALGREARAPGAGLSAPSVSGECRVVRLVGRRAGGDPDLIPGAGVVFTHLEDDQRDALRRFTMARRRPCAELTH